MTGLHQIPDNTNNKNLIGYPFAAWESNWEPCTPKHGFRPLICQTRFSPSQLNLKNCSLSSVQTYIHTSIFMYRYRLYSTFEMTGM